jgi:hypothetical protein
VLQVLFATDIKDAKIVGILRLPAVEALQVCRELTIASRNCNLLLENFCMLYVEFVERLLVTQFNNKSIVWIVRPSRCLDEVLNLGKLDLDELQVSVDRFQSSRLIQQIGNASTTLLVRNLL